MSAIRFRFVTECEVTVEGNSYEEAYMAFKDMMHGDQAISLQAGLTVYPPEDASVWFCRDTDGDFREIPMVKGDFRADILNH